MGDRGHTREGFLEEETSEQKQQCLAKLRDKSLSCLRNGKLGETGA